jgi:hypothetical protein
MKQKREADERAAVEEYMAAANEAAKEAASVRCTSVQQIEPRPRKTQTKPL